MKLRAGASATADVEPPSAGGASADDVSSVRFDRLLAELSVGFVGVTAADLDAEIRHALERLIAVLDVDVGVVMETVAEGQRIRITHACAGAGRDLELPEFMETDFPWLAERLASGEVTRLSHLDELPAEAAEDRHSIARRGVQSIVICPVVVGGTVSAAVAFASIGRERDWPEALVDRLRLIGRMFAGALARRRAEERLAAERGFAEAFIQSLPGMVFMADEQNRLAHVARVSAMGELAAAIAHELNQPLTAIRTNAQATRKMLARGGVDRAELDEALGDITSDAVRAGEIIRRLRDLLRKEDAERVPLDVNELIRGVEPFARADLLEHNAVLVMQLAARLPSVIGDRIQLQQVVLNLIRNASEAMRDAAQREIVMSTASAGPETIEVTVRDHGSSLSDEEFGRMFQPFYTTKPSGLGIGLSLSRSIIEAHGGLLWATRNDVDTGITMHFTLPIEPTARR